MNDLGERFERLGLSQYFEAFVGEGFDTWDTVLDITESDLNSLNVKLGHRRKLQRAIAESRGHTSDRPLPLTLGRGNSGDGQYRSGDDSAPEGKGKQPDAPASGNAGTSTKRKYRRHPKPDEHAPERPPSAYVIFSNQVRETLKGQELSFTEIAKVVGERWQVLPADAREACERQANAAKEKYYAELAEYKKTPQYEAYQKYLEEFKAKHAAPQKDGGKRSKLETETSTSTRSSSHEHGERMPVRRVSTAQSDPSFTAQHRAESSPPVNPSRLPGYPYGSKSNSPATHSTSLNSPRATEHYSPISASPRSATIHKETSFDTHSNPLSRDSRERQSEPSVSMAPPMYGQQYQPASTTPPSHPYGAHYQSPIDLPSRRSFREPMRLPPLTHEDTTLSSESGYSSTSYSQSQPLLPVPDASKSLRVLPQPIPSHGGVPSSPTHHRPLPPSTAPSQQSHDPRATSSLAALIRASELARVADDEIMADKEGSP